MTQFLTLSIAACIGLAFVADLSADENAFAVPTSWQSLRSSYEKCEKTSGHMPKFFESVAVDHTEKTIKFTVTTVEHGVFTLDYHPDGIVRRGTDYHYLKDGTVLPDLPSHEASFWKDGALVREEVTYLPSGQYALETNTLTVGDDGALSYELRLDDEVLLTAVCP